MSQDEASSFAAPVVGRIVSILHNCFILKLDSRTFLFDCPSDEHLTSEEARLITSYIRHADLTVFCSHSHADHFNANIASLTQQAARRVFVLSDDIADMFPEAVPEGSLIVEPDETITLDGMTICTLTSNDLGVAFLVSVQGLNIYFAGDLANWVWPSMPPKARDMAQASFSECLQAIGREHVHVAFSNLDTRLDNLAGGLEVMHTLQPDIFVPMHGFGDPAWMPAISPLLRHAPCRVFTYTKPGDTLCFQLPKDQKPLHDS